MSDRVYICTYADNQYIQHLAAMLLSLNEVSSSENNYHVTVFLGECSKKDLEKLSSTLSKYLSLNIRYKIIHCNFKLDDSLVAKKAYLSSSIYDKIVIYDKIDVDVDKVVFLDADIILKKDPAILYNESLNNNIIAAVKDPVFETFDKTARETLKLNKDQYFNSGVMLLDLEAWRREEITAKSLKFAKDKWDKTPYHDQDAFNYSIAGRWQEISPLWNPRTVNLIEDDFGKLVTLSKREVYKRNITYLVHYSGPDKPWLYMSFHPRKQDYLRYLRLSEYRDFKYPDFNWINFFKKQFLRVRRTAYFFRTAIAARLQ